MAVMATKAIDVDKVGKIVALCLSALFVLFSLWYIGSHRMALASEDELFRVDALFIVLAGPIAYFFANVTSDKIRLTTPLGKLALGGGYCVAVAALLVPRALPPRDEWRLLTIEGSDVLLLVKPVEQNPPGSVFPLAREEEMSKYKFVCNFRAGEPEVQVEFKIDDGFGPRSCRVTIPRGGKTFDDVSLVCSDGVE